MANTPPIIPTVPSVSNGPSNVASQQNPPPLPQLPPGTIVQGTVSGQDGKGNPVIRTENLLLTLSTRFPLKEGANITVRLDPPVTRDSMPAIRILSIDGKLPAQQVATNTPPAADAAKATVPQGTSPQAEQARPVGVLLEMIARPGAAPAQRGGAEAAGQPVPQQAQAPARGVAAEVMLSEGQKASAVLLRPALSANAVNMLTQLAANTGQPLPAAASALRPGLQLQVQLVQIPSQPATGGAATSAPSSVMATPPDNSGGMQPLAAQLRAGYAQYAKQPAATMGAPSPAQPSAQNPAQPPVSSPPLPVAGQMPAQPFSPTAPNAPQNLTAQVVDQLLTRAEAQPLPAGQMAGVVMGKESGGALTVQTRLGMFTLPQLQGAAPQAGTVMTWQVNQIQIPQATEQAAPIMGSSGVLAAASQFTAEWSALDELSTLLHGMQTSAAAQTLQRMVPHIGSNFSAGLLFFMSVLRRGDVSEWMGRDMIEQLERMGKGDLIQRLGNDMNAVRSMFAEQQPGSWQALFFPVMVDKQLQHAQMYLKPDEQDKKDGGRGTRFIVELELSNLGPMQMDGLVKKREGRTQFDLVLRTMAEMPENIKNDIYGIFENAQQVTGLSGSLNFRMVQEFPVNPLEEIQQQNNSGSGGIIA